MWYTASHYTSLVCSYLIAIPHYGFFKPDDVIIVQRKRSSQSHIITIVLSALFMLSMVGTAIDWYNIDRSIVEVVSGGQPITFIFFQRSGPTGLHLAQNIAFFGSFILADWLIVF